MNYCCPKKNSPFSLHACQTSRDHQAQFDLLLLKHSQAPQQVPETLPPKEENRKHKFRKGKM